MFLTCSVLLFVAVFAPFSLVQGAPPPTANNTASINTLSMFGGGNVSAEAMGGQNPACAVASYQRYSVITAENGTETDQVVIQNGCCIYQDGRITDTVTNRTRDASADEQEKARAFIAASEREANKFGEAFQRRIQEFFCHFLDMFRGEKPQGANNNETKVIKVDEPSAPDHGLSPFEEGGGGKKGGEWALSQALPCFCSEDHCVKRQSQNATAEEQQLQENLAKIQTEVDGGN